MKKQELRQAFAKFISGYDSEVKDGIWANHSKQFREFWHNKILSGGEEELDDAEIDPIIRILDRNGKGNTQESEAVARAMIAQGAWRRMFNGLKEKRSFARLLNDIFIQEDRVQKSNTIDILYKLNEERTINNLTGPRGNALCAMLAAFDPIHNLSVISLNDRRRLYEFLGLEGKPDFGTDSIGYKISSSNEELIKFFTDAGINYSARTISVFLYSTQFKSLWKTDKDESEPMSPSMTTTTEPQISDPAQFYMERQLEDFLVKNWEKTELGKKYELYEEDEHSGQQFPTAIGKIDILAKDRKTGQYVIIKLKKGQPSDDTVGQITRYMGWLEEHKTDGIPTKGIIIAEQYDERLYYGLKKLKDVEVYLYKVDFKLEEFKKET